MIFGRKLRQMKILKPKSSEYDDRIERRVAIELYKRLTKKRFVSYVDEKQSCIDIYSANRKGDIIFVVEVERNLPWKDKEYPTPELHIPPRKFLLREMALGNMVEVAGVHESFDGVDVNYCQISNDLTRAAIVKKDALIEFIDKKHLRHLSNSRQDDYKYGDKFYFVPLDHVEIVDTLYRET